MTGTDTEGTPAIMNTTFENIPNLTNYVVEESEEDIFKIIGSAENPDEDREKEPASDSIVPDDGKEDAPTDVAKDTLNANGNASNETQPKPVNTMLIVLVVILAVGLALIVLLVCLILKKNKGGSGNKAVSGERVKIRLDAISGEIKKPKGAFNISGTMVIGSSSRSDIVLKADGVCSSHAKLLVSNGVVYIQDISESSGVFMGGMRLQAPNRLSDGDEITIGSARIVIRL